MDTHPKRPVRIEIRGLAGYLVLDRHERRNALDGPTVEGLVQGLARHAADPALRCIVLAAEGSTFCGGADIRECDRGSGRTGLRTYAMAIRAIITSPLPVVARVQGPAVAGGVGLVAACHLAVASPRARFFTPEMRSGLYPLMVHALVEGCIGRKHAFGLGLTGVELDAARALELGLVNSVVEESQMDAVIEGWTSVMGTLSHERLSRAISALGRTAGMDVLERVTALQKDLDDLSSSG